MNEKYIERETSGGKAYIKSASLSKLREVDAIIFDCDGVLIDVRGSCDEAIRETVAQMFRRLTGISINRDFISKEVIYLFRKSGDFNNDWSLTQTILLFLLGKLPTFFSETFMNNFDGEALTFLSSIKEDIENVNVARVIQELNKGLKDFAEKISESGLTLMENMIDLKPSEQLKKYLRELKALLRLGEVGESTLVTFYEEIFCGSHLFKIIYGLEPRFYKGEGFLKEEKVVASFEKLDEIASVIGGAKFGIASGRPFKLAEHTLGELLGKFVEGATIFLDEIEAESRRLRGKGLEVDLKKPNPFSLLKASEALKPFRFLLYVGDSMEDALAVERANQANPSFLFAGVYKYSSFEASLKQSFFDVEADLILPSVNELPEVLSFIKESGK